MRWLITRWKRLVCKVRGHLSIWFTDSTDAVPVMTIVCVRCHLIESQSTMIQRDGYVELRRFDGDE
jgi:hypothetical protein